MKTKISILLALVFVVAALIGPQLKFSSAATSVNLTQAVNSTEDFRFSEGFDDSESAVLDRWDAGELCCTHSIELTTPADAGARAARFEYRKADRDELGGQNAKSDLARPKDHLFPTNTDTWFGFSMMIPQDQVLNDSDEGAVMFQLHSGARGGFEECGGRPPVTVTVVGGRYRVSVRHGDPCSDDPRFLSLHDAGPVVKGRYVDFVLNIKFTLDDDGYVKVWVLDGQDDDSRPKVNYPGAVGYSTGNPYVRIGIYVSRMREAPEKYSWDKFVVYFDQYRQGFSYAEVAPRRGGGNPTPTPTVTPTPSPSPSPGATIINEGFSQSSDINYISALRGGIWRVTGGELRLTDPAPTRTNEDNGNLAIYARTIVPAGDFTLTTEASAVNTASQRNDFSIAFNVQDSNNYYFASFSESNNASTSGIFRVRNGAVTELSDIGNQITAGETYTVRVERRESQINVYLNDALAATATDNAFTGGYVGFGTKNDAATFDALKVVQ